METATEAIFKKDLENKKIIVTKHFNATPERVWEAWTQSEILDQWWAPKPWKAETKKQDFKEGGSWLYAMVGPNDERQYAKAKYTKINAPKSFEVTDSFTDESGNDTAESLKTHWKNEFKPSANGTDVIITITSKKEEHLEKQLEMGFEEGFTKGLENLDQYLDQNS